MRRPVVMICLFALTLTGCANQSVSFAPPGLDREELLEVIARNGREVPHEALPAPPPPTPAEEALDRAGRVLATTAYYTGAGVLVVSLLVVCAVLHAHPSLSWPSSS